MASEQNTESTPAQTDGADFSMFKLFEYYTPMDFFVYIHSRLNSFNVSEEERMKCIQNVITELQVLEQSEAITLLNLYGEVLTLDLRLYSETTKPEGYDDQEGSMPFTPWIILVTSMGNINILFGQITPTIFNDSRVQEDVALWLSYTFLETYIRVILNTIPGHGNRVVLISQLNSLRTFLLKQITIIRGTLTDMRHVG